MTTGKHEATPTATQAVHPWRATLRTMVAAVVGLAAMWAIVVEAIGLDPGIPWVAASIAATGAITRVLALPGVIDWVEKYLPWLAPGSGVDADILDYDAEYDGAAE